MIDAVIETLRDLKRKVATLEGVEVPVTKVGTWTPVFSGSGGGGSMTYSSQVGRWSRVGSTVTIWYKLQLSALASAPSGNLRISGLPFTALATGATLYYGTYVAFALNFTIKPIYAPMIEGVTYIDLYDTNGSALAASNLTATSYLIGSGSYLI